MKRIDFENGTVTENILSAALPMLAAQILSLLYNIVDRIYIGRIPNIGTTALGAVGLCFPLIMIITACSNLFGSGGAPLFSINRGKGDKEQANRILNTSFSMVCASALLLMGTGLLFAKPLLILFGASKNALTFARPYMMLYLLGTLPSMIATGMNPFINAQGYSTTGMFSVAIGAIANILLDPLFIFTFHLGVNGAAAATVLSQILSALFVFHFLRRKAEIKVRLLRKNELSSCIPLAKSIISLGTSGFIMQLTNSLVSICCNHVLSVTGGDVYVSVMTIVSSVRQMVETPIYAITEGSSPIISYNYGALRPTRVKKAGITMALMALVYTGLMWSVIILAPEYFGYSTVSRCRSRIKTVFCCIYLYGSAVYRSDCFQIFKQTETGDLLFPAAQGVYRCTADLSSAIHFPHGNGRRISCRTRIKCDRWQSVFYHNAVYGSAGAEPDGKSVKYAFSSATIIS